MNDDGAANIPGTLSYVTHVLLTPRDGTNTLFHFNRFCGTGQLC